MRRHSPVTGRLVACLLAAHGAAIAAPVPAPPAWAYPIDPPVTGVTSGAVGALRHVPASRATYTNAQVDDMFVAPDWHPGDHPAAPPIVTQGRAPDVYACGHCHRLSGSGGPENARLAGLPAAYIVTQLRDYQRGLRRTAVPSRFPPTAMMKIAKSLTAPEMDAAARYFSVLPPQPRIRVIEAAQVPRTHVAGWRLAADADGGQEDIGARIIELPDVPQDFESRDSRATFTAYVPPGSLARGQLLVNSGTGVAAVPCMICHGAGLKGLGVAPPLAGRSPTYLTRQLYEIQNGIRAGANVAPMKVAIAALTQDDLIAAAAWAASLR